DASCKVVRKQDPGEKVGVVADIDGRIGIVEYTEIGEIRGNTRGADGQLLYWAGSIAIHAFGREFLRRVAERADALLPYHASPKAIPSVDANGQTRAARQPNGLKLERFLFHRPPAPPTASVRRA